MAPRHVLSRTQHIDRTLDDVFDFFSDAANLEPMTPGFLRFRILTPLPITMQQGTLIDYSLSLFGVPVRWRTRITEWEPGRRFVDEQESGPFAVWKHTHEFSTTPQGRGVHMRDIVEYALPFGFWGSLAHRVAVRSMVHAIFDHRASVVSDLIARSQKPQSEGSALTGGR